MTDERKKAISKTIKELYLYPFRSKHENILRCIVWMGSWIIGIVAQQSVDQRALGGAYLIYSISLLSEFILEIKKSPLARVLHSLFCSHIIVMLLGSLFLIFGDQNSDHQELHWSYNFLCDAPYFVGWMLFIYMFFNIIFVLIEFHKFIYDEEINLSIETETNNEAERKLFVDNLNGTFKGGNA